MLELFLELDRLRPRDSGSETTPTNFTGLSFCAAARRFNSGTYSRETGHSVDRNTIATALYPSPLPML